MKKCAFLTMDDLSEFVVYDELLHKPLANLGWQVEKISWRKKNVNWDNYSAVIIRSTWDYQNDAPLFLQVLDKINASSAQLENNLDLVKWNIDKFYLHDLEQKGISIVPTHWPASLELQNVKSAFNDFSCEEIIIKPRISANADNTFRLNPEKLIKQGNKLVEIFKHRPFMIQPFLQNITTEGEFSLFFFGGEYSHSIVKIPKANDFRVQEEHGGILKSVQPEIHLLEAAYKTMQAIKPLPLYCRLDFVRNQQNSFVLMEIELIEPSLYFNMDQKSAERFAKIFNEWMSH